VSQLMFMNIPADLPREKVAILSSGGVESAILCGLLGKCFESVQPIYMRFGLAWEPVEEHYLRRFLQEVGDAKLQPLKVLEMPMSDAYGEHWSVTGFRVPDRQSPDEAVYLPGRNLMLVCKAAIWCALNQVSVLALGHLQTNPFPDATDEFFDNLTGLVKTSLQIPFDLKVIRPFSGLHKGQVLQLGEGLPLQYTFSCIQPTYDNEMGGKHCGKCNKCEERRSAFANLSFPDPTKYGTPTLEVPQLIGAS
jgi:7-cyano-7-deazaguanine synthase